MNLNEYHSRLEKMKTPTGIPSCWAELDEVTGERDRYRNALLHLRIYGDDCGESNCEHHKLAKDVWIDYVREQELEEASREQQQHRN